MFGSKKRQYRREVRERLVYHLMDDKGHVDKYRVQNLTEFIVSGIHRNWFLELFDCSSAPISTVSTPPPPPHENKR